MAHTNRRRRGGQPGNQNARKHGFYSKMKWVPEEQDALPPEATPDELDRDIAIIHMKVRSILANDPEDTKLLAYSLSLLHRLVRTLSITPNTIQAQTRDSSLELHPRFSPGPVVFACPSPKDEGRHGDSKQSAPPCAKISVF